MLILALEGALGPLTAAVLDTLSGSYRVEAAPARDALEAGLQAVDAALHAMGKTTDSLERIGVTVGPGGFTGLRIALTYAKALAFALKVPLVGISSFDAVSPAGFDAAMPMLAAVRGRAGAACARLRVGLSEERLCASVPEVAAWAAARIGDGLQASGALEELGPALEAAGVRLEHLRAQEPPALRVARLAAEARPETAIHGVQPDYGERPHVTVPR